MFVETSALPKCGVLFLVCLLLKGRANILWSSKCLSVVTKSPYSKLSLTKNSILLALSSSFKALKDLFTLRKIFIYFSY